MLTFVIRFNTGCDDVCHVGAMPHVCGGYFTRSGEGACLGCTQLASWCRWKLDQVGISTFVHVYLFHVLLEMS
jgi:hypothetical protein